MFFLYTRNCTSSYIICMYVFTYVGLHFFYFPLVYFNRITCNIDMLTENVLQLINGFVFSYRATQFDSLLHIQTFPIANGKSVHDEELLHLLAHYMGRCVSARNVCLSVTHTSNHTRAETGRSSIYQEDSGGDPVEILLSKGGPRRSFPPPTPSAVYWLLKDSPVRHVTTMRDYIVICLREFSLPAKLCEMYKICCPAL